VPLDLRISLSKLAVFCAVVETGGVGRAADQLFLSQPVVSTHIHSLEKRLDAKLFERAGRGVELTPVGSTVYEWANAVLSRSRELSRDLEGVASGSSGSAVIVAGMTAGTYVLPPVLIDFHRGNPDARVTLLQQAPERALTSTSVGDADFAIVLGDEHHLALPNLHHERLRNEDLVLVAAPDSVLPSTIAAADLADIRFVCSPQEGSLRRAMIDQKLKEVGVLDRDIVLALDHPTAIKECVSQDVGPALLFRSSVAKELSDGTLREVVISDAELSIPLFLVYRSEKRFVPLQQRLIDHIRTALKEQA
jgi:DNA-binding transcriptional LysR family regulator